MHCLTKIQNYSNMNLVASSPSPREAGVKFSLWLLKSSQAHEEVGGGPGDHLISAAEEALAIETA